MRLARGLDKRLPGDVGGDVAARRPAAGTQRRLMFWLPVSRQCVVSNSMACCVLDRWRMEPVTPTETTTGLENQAVCIGNLDCVAVVKRPSRRKVSSLPITVA